VPLRSYVVALLLVPALLVPTGLSAENFLDTQPSLTLWGQYVRGLTPAGVAGAQGGGGRLQAAWPLDEQWSVGLEGGEAVLAGPNGSAGFGSVGALVRYSLPPLGGLNLYAQAGLGYDLFRNSFSQPLGGSTHGQLIVGDTYVLSHDWALDAGVGWDALDGPPSLTQAVSPRLGINYRFGGQPARNLYQPAAPPVQLGAQPETLGLTAPLAQLLGFRLVTVRSGDNLWRLARRPSVLGNGFLWPLIYRSNRDQIQDPDRLEPGLKLKIFHHYDRDQAQAALAAARDRSRLAAFLVSGDLVAR
jgi:hypothetical protein